MYLNRIVSYGEISNTSQELVRNFTRMLIESLISSYYMGSKGVLILTPNEEVNSLMRYFINELFGATGVVQFFDDAEVTIRLEKAGFSSSIFMVVRYTQHGQEASVCIRNFDEVSKNEYNLLQTIASMQLGKVIMLGIEDFLTTLPDNVYLRYSKNH